MQQRPFQLIILRVYYIKLQNINFILTYNRHYLTQVFLLKSVYIRYKLG
jgi:hypothetical protein